MDSICIMTIESLVELHMLYVVIYSFTFCMYDILYDTNATSQIERLENMDKRHRPNRFGVRTSWFVI